MTHAEVARRNRQLIALCREGQSAASLAVDFGLTRPHVNAILRRAGIVPPVPRALNADRDEVIRSLRRKKRSLEEIAARFGLTNQRVSQICKVAPAGAPTQSVYACRPSIRHSRAPAVEVRP